MEMTQPYAYELLERDGVEKVMDSWSQEQRDAFAHVYNDLQECARANGSEVSRISMDMLLTKVTAMSMPDGWRPSSSTEKFFEEQHKRRSEYASTRQIDFRLLDAYIYELMVKEHGSRTTVCSTWTEEQRLFHDWLVTELREHHGDPNRNMEEMQAEMSVIFVIVSAMYMPDDWQPSRATVEHFDERERKGEKMLEKFFDSGKFPPHWSLLCRESR